MNSKKLHESPTIVFLSGAGLQPSIWDDVRTNLSMPSAALVHDRTATATLQGAAQDILAQIQDLKATSYIIVAHSLGGVIGAEVARGLGDAFAGFIGVSATIPAPGKSFASTLPFPQNLIMPTLLKVAGTKPPVTAIRKGLCSDLNDKQAAKIIEAFTPEPVQLYIDHTSASALPAGPYLYIRTLQDKQLTAKVQLAMINQLPKASVIDMVSGHLPMVGHPAELAAIINDFAAEL